MTRHREPPDWFQEEADRAAQQAKGKSTVNSAAPAGPSPSVRRLNKAFQVEEGRAAKWHLLVAKQKAEGRGHQSGPELIDEALDLLFEKHEVE